MSKVQAFFGTVAVLGGHIWSWFCSGLAAELATTALVVFGLGVLTFNVWVGKLGKDLQE